MSLETFEHILSRLQNLSNQEYLTLHGLGEPLLDKELPEKIALAAKMGFRGIGFATNCTELLPDMSERLLKSGLHTLICSVDGATKKTHEKIRIGTDFNKIIDNIKNFVRMRDEGRYNTRVLVRFIRQEENFAEWDAYCSFWSGILNKEKRDGVLRFDVHNWGDDSKIPLAPNMDSTNSRDSYCEDLNSRLIIASDGTLRLCCADDIGFFDLGSAADNDPIALWNGEIFQDYRSAMQGNRLFEMKHCKTCSILYCRKNRILPE